MRNEVRAEIALTGPFRSDRLLTLTVTATATMAVDTYVVMHAGASPCGATLPGELGAHRDELTEGLMEDTAHVGRSVATREFFPRPGRWRICGLRL